MGVKGSVSISNSWNDSELKSWMKRSSGVYVTQLYKSDVGNIHQLTLVEAYVMSPNLIRTLLQKPYYTRSQEGAQKIFIISTRGQHDA